MNSVVFVSPSLYLCGQYEHFESPVPRPGHVPILKSDLAKFKQTMSLLKQENSSDKVAVAGQAAVSDGDRSSKQVSDEASAAAPLRYVDLKSFLPISLDQQLHTVCINHFPKGLDYGSIEKIVEKLEHLVRSYIKSEKNDGDSESVPAPLVNQWTLLDCVNSITLFVNFHPTKYYEQVVHILHAVMKRSEHNASVHMDENTRRYVDDLRTAGVDTAGVDTPAESALDEMAQQFDTLVTLLQGESNTHEKGGTAVAEYSVDVSTLSDLPASSLDQLCEDIVEFRTRVLTLEREKRNKAVLEERRRRQQHLKQIFDRIKATTESAGPGGRDTGTDTDTDENDSGGNDGGNDEDDLEIEKRRVHEAEAAEDLGYSALLREFEETTLVDYRTLHQELGRLHGYEAHLNKNRGVFLKELLHSATDPYYDHHRAYKDEEAQRDDDDREHEAAEAASPAAPAQPAQPSPAGADSDSDSEPHRATHEQPKIKLALSHRLKTNPPDDLTPPAASSTAAPDFAASVQALRDSGLVDELVKEYLGVYEHDLVGYILHNIAEHQSKEALEVELSETFDEDAPVLVARIWDALGRPAMPARDTGSAV